MSTPTRQFPFVARDPTLGPASLAPMLPITLQAPNGMNTAVSALLDTGAAINVLPYSVGAQLGFNWDQQTTSIQSR